MYETYEEITGCCFTSDVWESMAASPSFVQGHPAQWTCHLPFAGLIPSEPDSAFNCSSVGAPGCGEWLGEVGRLLHTACFSKDREPLELFSKESFNEFRRCPSTHPLRFRGIAELGRCIGRLGGPEVGFHLGHRHLSLATMPPCQASQLLVGLFKLVKGSGDLLMLEFSSLFACSFPHTSCIE